MIASGSSTTQVRAISDNIIGVLKGKGERVWHTEGAREALWILLDYGDVVVHVFLEETRAFYQLEKLWSNAPKKRFADIGTKKRLKTRPKPKKAVKKTTGKKKRQNALWRNRKRGRSIS